MRFVASLFLLLAVGTLASIPPDPFLQQQENEDDAPEHLLARYEKDDTKVEFWEPTEGEILMITQTPINDNDDNNDRLLFLRANKKNKKNREDEEPALTPVEAFAQISGADDDASIPNELREAQARMEKKQQQEEEEELVDDDDQWNEGFIVDGLDENGSEEDYDDDLDGTDRNLCTLEGFCARYVRPCHLHMDVPCQRDWGPWDCGITCAIRTIS